MTRTPSLARPLRALIPFALALLAGCSSHHVEGDKCYAKALPSSGEGGLAWGATESIASRKSITNCMRYASRSGGTPDTCQVVAAKCR